MKPSSLSELSVHYSVTYELKVAVRSDGASGTGPSGIFTYIYIKSTWNESKPSALLVISESLTLIYIVPGNTLLIVMDSSLVSSVLDTVTR